MPVAEPDVAGEILLIPVCDIEIGERLRPIDENWATALGQVMVREGQQTPIEICSLPGKSGWRLVAGAHRVRGAQLAEISYIEARVVSPSVAHRRMREISENLWRKNLDPMDRAAFVAEAHQLLRTRAGLEPHASAQSIAANARWKKDLDAAAVDASATIADAYGLDAQLGESIGLSERTIRNDLLIYRRISPALIEQLRGHPVASNATQLRALAKRDAREQRDIVEVLVQGHAKSVGEAVSTLLQKPKPRPEDKRLSAFVGTFGRMGLAEKKGALATLKGMLPAGYKLLSSASDATPADKYRLELLEASDQALDLLIKLRDGEPVEDDEISAAAGAMQLARLALCAGAVPMPEAQS